MARVTISNTCKQFLKNKINIRAYASDDPAKFPGIKSTYTEKLEFATPSPPIPIYRVMDTAGKIVNPQTNDVTLDTELIIKMYKHMTLLNQMDNVLLDSQRQGRIAFYMTNWGEEAAQVGSAAAIDLNDLVFAQYREVGMLLWRGFTPQRIMDQCYGNMNDCMKGRMMPLHYGSKDTNVVTISSPLCTQVPQASGAGYVAKGKNKIVMCYLGDGAASEGDFHAALNFAATLECPVIFFVRNNGYAISTPSCDQYRGDGIGGRGSGYGMNTLRVDGNDIFAVYYATKKAKAYCLKESKPVLLEAVSYRVGDHSTSDDSSGYRPKEEINWWKEHNWPITRLKKYMENKGIWDEEKQKAWLKACKDTVMAAMTKGEKTLKLNWKEMLLDVYKDMPISISRQMKELNTHVTKYKEHYPVAKHAA